MMNFFSALNAFDYALLAYGLLLVVFGYCKGFFSTLLTSSLLYLSLAAALLLAPRVTEATSLPLWLCFFLVFVLVWILTRVIHFAMQPMLIALPAHWLGRVGGVLLNIPRAAIMITAVLMWMELIVPDEPADFLTNSALFPIVSPLAGELKHVMLRHAERIAQHAQQENWIE